MNETYERILLRIKDHVAPLVCKTLQWLAHGKPNLEIDALLEALSIDDDSYILDPEARPTEEDLLLYCSSLIRKNGAYLELAHFTVQEYLQTVTVEHEHLGQFRLSLDAKKMCAKTCLSYLCLPVFNQPPGRILDDITTFREQYPFHVHASIAWNNYMENLWTDSELRQLYRRLFDPKKTQNFVLYTAQHFWVRGVPKAFDMSADVRSDIQDDVFGDKFRPLHVAAMFGLTEVCQWLVHQGCDVNLASPLGVPLELCIYAALSIFTFMGITMMPVDESEIAATIGFLVDSGADHNKVDVNFINRLYINPITTFNVSEFVESLRQRAAKPSLQQNIKLTDDSFHSKLLHCIACDQAGSVKALSKDPRFRMHMEEAGGYRILHLAARNNAVQTITFLLDIGMDPASQDGDGYNVLYYCVGLDDDEVLCRLVAFPNVTDPAKDGRTLWHVASAAGSSRMLDLLIEKNIGAASSLLEEYEGRTPLLYAITSGNESSCMILARAMHTQAMPLDDPAILLTCIAMGHSKLLVQLLNYGQDIQMTTKSQRSAWFFVTSSTPTEIFGLLLATDLSPLSQDDTGKTALHALLDGTRHANICGNVENDEESLIDRNALTARLDVVTGTMLDHLLTSSSARSQDNSGHTVWFYFCTNYVPRIVKDQNTLVNDTLEGLTRRLVLHHAIEAYEEEIKSQSGVDLFIKSCLESFDNSKGRGRELIGRLLNVIISCDGITITSENETATWLLAWSIENKENTISQVLLDCGVDIHSSNKVYEEQSGLVTSARGHGNMDMFVELMKYARPDSLNKPDESGLAPIHATCIAEDASADSIKRLKLLLKAGASPDARTRDGNRTALHLAACNNLSKHAQVLLEHRADMTLRDDNGWDAMACAVYSGSFGILQDLNNFGSDTEIDYEYKCAVTQKRPHSLGCSLVHLATLMDQVEMLIFLKDTGCLKNMHEAADDGKTPLYFAAFHDAKKCAEWLVKNGADLDAKTHEKQRTALHAAIANGCFSIVRLLVSAGAGFPKDKWNKRPDQVVRKGKETELVKALEGLHVPDAVRMNLVGADTQPFFTAIRTGNVKSCRMMIQMDPYIISTPLHDCGLCTPLIFALRAAHAGVINLLVEKGATTAGFKCSKHSSEASDTCGASPVHLAITRPELNSRLPVLLDLLCQQQTDDWNGVTPVHVAAAFNPGAIDIIHSYLDAKRVDKLYGENYSHSTRGGC